MTDNNETLLTFPCEFTIKVFGKDTEAFFATVSAIIRHHVPTVADDAFLQSRVSENGTYRAMSVTIQATSKPQLDAIYQALSSSPEVLMVL